MNELPMYCFAAFLHEENFSPGNYFDNVGDSFHAMRLYFEIYCLA